MNVREERSVLIIAYLFPPLGGSGALRPVKLAKYLPSFGWKPIILTARNPDSYYAIDPDLAKDLSTQTIVERSFFLRAVWLYRILNPLRARKVDRAIRRLLVHPDEQVGWIPFAYFLAMKIVREHKIEAIYSTSGPLSCAIIAYLVKRRTGLTWIAEFRDEWFEDPQLDFATGLHRRLHYKLEGVIVNNADRIITMAPVFSRLLSKHDGSSGKFTTIPAGYDPDEFEGGRPLRAAASKNRTFITAFVGLFYKTFRPVAFLRAVEGLVDEGKIDPREIRIQFVGANSPSCVGVKDVHQICEFTGFVPRRRALEYMSEADVLLLLLSKERGKDIVPSKMFEYMASGRPILALIPPDGDAAGIIRKTRSGMVVDFDDVGEIKRAYLELYRRWKKHELLVQTDWEEVEKFDQKGLTRKVAGILTEAVRSK